MDFRVEITKPAIADLAEIVKYIAHDRPQAAARTGDKLIAKAESLSQMPLRGRLVPERRAQDCRELILKPYRIIYRVKQEMNLVQVLRIWHGARGTPVIYEPEQF